MPTKEDLEDPTTKSKSAEKSKKQVKQSSQRLHPLKYNILNNPFFKYSDDKNTIENVKRLVNLDIMLTTVSTVLMLLLVVLIVRLPSLPSSGGTAAPTVLPETGEEDEEEDDGTIEVDGRTFVDNRNNNDGAFAGDNEEAEATKTYSSQAFGGFSIDVPESWEVVTENAETIRIEDTDNDFDTYVEFTSVVPDLTEYQDTGTSNVRDIYAATSIYRAEGFVKFGRATFASIPVVPEKFYLNYAGNVNETIVPILATFIAN